MNETTFNRLTIHRLDELIDYATAYGEFDENTPDGTTSVGSDPMSAPRRDSILALKELRARRSIAFSQACADIINERRRQVDEEEFDDEHDDKHSTGDLAYAAAAYAHYAGRSSFSPSAFQASTSSPAWPWSKCWWKPESPRRALVKAAALIIAEIDRLDRSQRANQTALAQGSEADA